ncbi:hypothetical protein PAPYR_8114 [Paratrimastix pyriformis]|uniref:Uncharacterized protein n=1 Tax=Paratrimastix pyriformis TaxID=342808 RepID=A0ABQ8UG18_9EUKA|nr:hypothetical protein PAPYR_8114 [Paratrimastix pyriformis]
MSAFNPRSSRRPNNRAFCGSRAPLTFHETTLSTPVPFSLTPSAPTISSHAASSSSFSRSSSTASSSESAFTSPAASTATTGCTPRFAFFLRPGLHSLAGFPRSAASFVPPLAALALSPPPPPGASGSKQPQGMWLPSPSRAYTAQRALPITSAMRISRLSSLPHCSHLRVSHTGAPHPPNRPWSIHPRSASPAFPYSSAPLSASSPMLHSQARRDGFRKPLSHFAIPSSTAGMFSPLSSASGFAVPTAS